MVVVQLGLLLNILKTKRLMIRKQLKITALSNFSANVNQNQRLFDKTIAILMEDTKTLSKISKIA